MRATIAKSFLRERFASAFFSILKLTWVAGMLFSLALHGLEAPVWVCDESDVSNVWRNDASPSKEADKIRIIPLVGSGIHARKIFDLTTLPAGVLKDAQAVSLRLFLQVADQSVAVKKIARNGLTESLHFDINGNRMTLGTDDGRLPSSRRWVDIDFPLSWLKEDTCVVDIAKGESTTNDDYVYLGVDTDKEPQCSASSIDGGRTYKPEHSALGGVVGEYMVRLVFWKQKRSLELDFARYDSSLMDLHDGVVCKDGNLTFNGGSGKAVLKNSNDLNVTTDGFTIAAIVRPRNNPPGSRKLDSNMIIACKPGAWFFGRTGNSYNLSFCNGDGRWNRALVEGEFPELDSWHHLAVVFERVNEKAQGNVGYNVLIYHNGDLQAKKFFQYDQPFPSKEPVMLGQGDFEGHEFNGDMAFVGFYRRNLNEEEIAAQAAACPLVKHLPAGRFELAENTANALAGAQKKSETPFGRWLVGALERAARTGFEQIRLADAIAAAETAVTAKSPSELAEQWNRSQDCFTMLEKNGFLLLAVRGKSSLTSPLAGYFNPVTGQDVFGDRGPGWAIRLDGTKVNDFSQNISFTVGNPKEINGITEFPVTWERPNAFRCQAVFRFAGQRLEQTFLVENLDSKRRLREVVFPQFILQKLPGKADKLVFPLFSGVIRENPTAGGGISGIYPGARAAMQFAGYFDELDNGLYAALEGTDGGARTSNVTGRNGMLRYEWNNPVGCPAGQTGGNSFTVSGRAVLEIYKGDWFEAGQVYKRFLEKEADWYVKKLPREDTPQWYRDNVFWLAASAGSKESQLYLREYLELPYAIWWAWWEDIDKGEIPWVISVAANKCIPELQDTGIRIHPYLNGRIWGFVENPRNAFDRTGQAGAKASGVLMENGKTFTENYGVPYTVMCPGAEAWRQVLMGNLDRVAAMGSDGAYFDQMPCGSPQLCYNPEHGHGLGDPTAWSRGYRQFLREARKKHPHIAFDGEDNTEIYAAELDGFMTWRFTEPDHVPLFQSVYGGGRVQFTARAFDAFGPGIGTYESSFAKLGEQFVCGEQIGWMHINDIRHGCPRRLYAKKLAHLRRGLLGYLNQADMLRPLKFVTAPERMTGVWGNTSGRKVTSDCLQHGAWKRIRDSRILLLFTNTTEETRTLAPILDYPGYKSLAICREGDSGPEFLELADGAAAPHVRLSGHSSEVWLLGRDFDREEARAVAEVTAKVGTFTDGGQSIQLSAPKFEICKQLQAETGKWLRANDASWQLFAFSERSPSLAFEPKDPDPVIDGNWILAREGAVVSYGEIDFGGKSPAALEVDIAVGQNLAGGKIQFWDITGDQRPDRCLAELTTSSTGRWFDYKTFRLPLKYPVTGKRKIIIRFLDKDCNFRAWRTLDE